MSLSSPEWLTKHGGSLHPGVDGRSSFVYFAEKPQYELTPIPVTGKYGCEIRQTINGRRLDGQGTFANAEAALQSGLEDLRKALGW